MPPAWLLSTRLCTPTSPFNTVDRHPLASPASTKSRTNLAPARLTSASVRSVFCLPVPTNIPSYPGARVESMTMCTAPPVFPPNPRRGPLQFPRCQSPNPNGLQLRNVTTDCNISHSDQGAFTAASFRKTAAAASKTSEFNAEILPITTPASSIRRRESASETSSVVAPPCPHPTIALVPPGHLALVPTHALDAPLRLAKADFEVVLTEPHADAHEHVH
ncbi:hypothetical protein D9615_010665 [Tricholomella constricta]|uniref:Uncharacterized protein n=1 Tax=Tricholomella constricta TaxID=117010 RepID=A0A8H5GJW3_9AGAR|nr:hypothetical protein D9615_010665 [Tricholomella constricta]